MNLLITRIHYYCQIFTFWDSTSSSYAHYRFKIPRAFGRKEKYIKINIIYHRLLEANPPTCVIWQLVVFNEVNPRRNSFIISTSLWNTNIIGGELLIHYHPLDICLPFADYIAGKRTEITLNENFRVSFFKNRTAAADSLQRRCAQKSNSKSALLWKNAWERFKFDTSHIIETPKCIRKSDNRAGHKKEVFDVSYRRLAVKHFLPYYKSKVTFLTGNAKKRYIEVIELLESWRADFPVDPLISVEKIAPINFPKADPPPPINLPLHLPPCLKPQCSSDIW